MPLYYLEDNGSIRIRNFCDHGGVLLDHVSSNTVPQRIEVILTPNQSTSIEHLVQFTRNMLSNSLFSSQSTSFHYVARIDWSLLQNQYPTINSLIDSLSCGHNLSYRLAFTNMIPGDQASRNAELGITSTGGTPSVYLKLPLHGFSNDGLVMYLSSGLSFPLTEICVEDTTPLDATTLSLTSKNLGQLLKAKANDIQRAAFPVTLTPIHAFIPELSRLYDLTFTQPEYSIIPTHSYEQDVLVSLSRSSCNASPRISPLSSCFETISILTLPANLFSSPLIRNKISRLRRLQELKIFFTPPFNTSNFGHLPAHRVGDFCHLRCLTFEGGTITQFLSLLPTLFRSPLYSSSPRSSISCPGSLSRSCSSCSSQTSSQRPRKFLNLTLLIPSLSSSSSLTTLVSTITTYIPQGVDIFKLNVKEWGVGEPTDGGWWTKAGVCMQGRSHGNGRKDGQVPNLIQIPGIVMKDLVHPCREEAGSQVKIPSRIKRTWKKIVTSARKGARIVDVRKSLEGTQRFVSKMWWWRHLMPLPVWWWWWWPAYDDSKSCFITVCCKLFLLFWVFYTSIQLYVDASGVHSLRDVSQALCSNWLSCLNRKRFVQFSGSDSHMWESD